MSLWRFRSRVSGGFLAARGGPQHIPVAVICIGAGLASVLVAVSVLKHYDLHYTAGVSPTLPATAVASYLLVKSLGYRLRIVEAAVAAAAILLMTYQTAPPLMAALKARTDATELAAADLQEIYAQRAGDKRPVAFLYRVPFPWYGEG